MQEKWYVATLIMKCKVTSADSGPYTFDEQVRLLQAANEAVAYEKAVALGKSQEISYQNKCNEEVFWQFEGLSSLEELESTIEDGIEIYSRLFESDDFKKIIQLKLTANANLNNF